jgi:hypothetical protein
VASYAFVAVLVCAGFLFIALRWLLALRGAALDRKIKLTWADKSLAAMPIGYTVFAFIAAGTLFDRADALLGAPGSAYLFPVFGTADHLTAAFLLLLLGGLGVASPLVVISVVEHYFARKVPDMVRIGRRAVFATLTGIRLEDVSESVAPAPPLDEDEKWRRLVRQSRRR